jgi:hypothetical protein
MGRKPKLTNHQCKEAIRRRDKGNETLAEIGRSYHVSEWTIARLFSGGVMTASDDDGGAELSAVLFSENGLFAALFDMVEQHCSTEPDRLDKAHVLPKARELMRLVAAAEKTA